MRLVSSTQAAKILGISLQGIHYRIKKGQLKSEKKDGKIFVYIEDDDTKVTAQNLAQLQLSNNSSNDLLKSKDEQIKLLKKAIKLMRKQYISEITRLEKNQDKILNVFQSEVDLLKSAFNEMKNIYQIEHKNNTIPKNNSSQDNSVSMQFMDIKDFFIYMKNHNKTDATIKQIILEKIKSGDKRFIYNKQTKEVVIYKDDFLDLI